MLEDALCADSPPTGRAVLVSGDVGMGKSALLAAAARRATELGHQVLRAAARPGSAAEPWRLLAELLRPLLAGQGGGADDVQRLLVAGCFDVGEGATVPRLARCAVALVAGASHRVPVLLLLDDLQWADPESLAAVSLASSQWGPQARVVVLGAWRGPSPPDERLRHWRLLPLGPLPEQDAVRLLRASTAVPLSTDRARVLAHRLGRCPLALVECDRVLEPRQVSGGEPLPDPLPLHQHLRAAWCGVVDALPSRARAALEVTCVLTTTRLDLLAAVLAQEGLDLADLDPAADAGLLHWPGPDSPASAPATAGPLLVSAVRGTVPRARHRRVHRLAADAARRLALPPDVCVRHLRAAAEPGDEAVATALEQEGERAHSLDLPAVAAQAWLTAAEVSPTVTARSRLAVRAARTWLTECTTAEDGARLVRTLAGLELAPDQVVWRDWLRAEVLADSDLAASAAALASAAARARTATPNLVGPLLLSTVVTAWLAGDPGLGLRAATDLRRWQDGSGGNDGLPPWCGTAVLGVAHLQAGEPLLAATAVRMARRQALAWEVDDATPVHLLVHTVTVDDLLLLSGAVPDRRLSELARRLADDDAAALAGVRLAQAWRARRRGDWTRARMLLDEGQALARAVRASAQEVSGLALLTELDALGGDAGLADHLDELRRRTARVGDRLGAAHAERAAGLALLAAGRPEQAVVHLEAAAAAPCLGRGVGDAPLGAAVDLVEALVQVGDLPGARARLQALEPLLEPHPDPAATPALHRCRGLVEQDAQAAARELGLALAADGSPSDPFEQARTGLLLGEQLRRSRQRSQARHELGVAAARFDGMGARPWARRARRELRAAGAPSAVDGPVEGLASLTPQERLVAQAVAEGASTREAAQALVLSPRTVEYHLGNAYRKLGVCNRAGLARVIGSAGRRGRAEEGLGGWL